MLLKANQLKVFRKDRLLFDIEELAIHQGDRIGLVGTNGSGKTTLLHVLAGQETPDSGTVAATAVCTLLPQLKQGDGRQSGGEMTQTYIERALSRPSALLLADEPTTHLDTEHIEWLEDKLRHHYQGALIVVSHDRAFLDAICTEIWELDHGKLHHYRGNYTHFAQQKELAHRQQVEAYEAYTQKKKQLEHALEKKKKKADKATKPSQKVKSSGPKIAKPYYANKQKKLEKTAKSIETRMEKLEKVEKVKDIQPIQMTQHTMKEVASRTILRVKNVDGKAGGKVLWKQANVEVRGGDKVAIIGKNGSGKTTFLRMLVNGHPGVTRSEAVKLAYFRQDLSGLKADESILQNALKEAVQDETVVRTVLARLGFRGDDVHKPVEVLSGGERVKTMLASLLVSDANVLMLDEPTNFLDLAAVEALEGLLKDYPGTVVFVSHDRRLIEEVATRIFHIHEERIEAFDGTYEAYKQKEEKPAMTNREEELLLIDMQLSEVLSRLSIEPSQELEETFQALLKQKKSLES
ncbi:ribosomal protection-like ABC-F family protein [Bacillus safensis]|uniref:ribosomal protection-like ABC-F family protein n=1 Tax=Bacillus safensis TaxID=561879 RepID=UPI0018C8B953|nr:ABC-F type ribosomal protection protein [Bacillus safensis]MBT2261414.1 ABC-F type ribosomal protection protein [Bacillus safensis]